MNNFKTICALATARMNCAIHIIRISGSEAYRIVNKITNKKILKNGYTIQRALIYDNDRLIDDVLINCFVAPKSYTGEDVLEINCHGGVVVADYIIKLLIRNGAQLATPGEFTKQALFNKKIDISQVEAINNLVHSQNEMCIYGSTNALIGKLTSELVNFQKELFLLIGQIEVNIDYPEFDDVPMISANDAINRTQTLLNKIHNLVINSKRFVPLNQGIKTIIIGNPNVGKSSLLNELSQTNKAIVSNIAGTTRDVIESSINIDGITLKLFDTAGIHETNDLIEQLGIKKAIEIIKESDLILLLKPLDEYSSKWDDFYYDIIKNRVHIVVYTKSDLVNDWNNKIKLKDNEVVISTKNHDLSTLIDKIKSIFQVSEFMNSDLNVVQSIRQIGILENIEENLKHAINNLSNGMPLDLVIYDYEQSNLKLNEILGNGNEYDFLDELFKNFCLGK